MTGDVPTGALVVVQVGGGRHAAVGKIVVLSTDGVGACIRVVTVVVVLLVKRQQERVATAVAFGLPNGGVYSLSPSRKLGNGAQRSGIDAAMLRQPLPTGKRRGTTTTTTTSGGHGRSATCIGMGYTTLSATASAFLVRAGTLQRNGRAGSGHRPRDAPCPVGGCAP
jgi:hypothetical protein